MSSFHLPLSTLYQHYPDDGEHAGFQDTLWGIGMRVAITSGVLAARSLLEQSDYDRRWQQSLQESLQSSVVNRAVYARLGNFGYRWLLRHLEDRSDVLMLLRTQYGPSRIKRQLSPLARSLT